MGGGMELTPRQLLRLRFAGAKDLGQTSLYLSGIFGSHPLVQQALARVTDHLHTPVSPEQLGFVAGSLASATGAAMLAKRFQSVVPDRAFSSDVKINSDVDLPSPEQWRQWDGVHIGYCSDTGKPVVLDWDSWMRHVFILGQSGVGKTVLGEWLMYQQIMRDGGMIFIDGKLDSDNLAKIHQMAVAAGREDDLLVINPGDPEWSNKYNPIMYGDADEVAARCLSLIPASEGNPGTDYYRQAANQGLTTLVNAFQSIPANNGVPGMKGLAYNFLDLAILLQSEKALLHLERQVDPNSDGGRMYRFWLDQYKSVNKDGETHIDLRKIRDLFGGIGGRLYQFGVGNFGKVTGTYQPDVRLFDAIINNKIIYVALPTMGKNEAASNFGKMIIGDYRTAVSWIQALPKHMRPWPPTLAFFDEAGSYVTQAWSRIFEQSRSAHQVLIPAVQTAANLETIGDELRAMVMGNTWTKIIFKLGENDSVDQAADMIGEEYSSQISLSYGDSSSESEKADTGTSQSDARSASQNYSEREESVARIHPNTIKSLGKGEAIVLYGNSKVYHVKIPMLKFSKELVDHAGGFELNSAMLSRRIKGIDLWKNIDRWLTDQGGI